MTKFFDWISDSDLRTGIAVTITTTISFLCFAFSFIMLAKAL